LNNGAARSWLVGDGISEPVRMRPNRMELFPSTISILRNILPGLNQMADKEIQQLWRDYSMEEYGYMWIYPEPANLGRFLTWLR